MKTEVLKAKGKYQKANGKRSEEFLLLLNSLGMQFAQNFRRRIKNKRKVPPFCLLIFAFCLLLSPGFAQDDTAQKRQYRLFNGTRVSFSLGTDMADSQLTNRIQVSDLNSVNRVLVDQKSGIFFGYTLKVEPVGNSNKYRVFLEPLGQEEVAKIKRSRWYEQARAERTARAESDTNAAPATTGLTVQSGRKPQPQQPPPPQSQPAPVVPVTRYPLPQTIEDGDTIAVDVLVNPATGDKLTDRITISSKDLPAPAANKKQQSQRDFTIDDIELTISDYRLFVNHEMVTEERPHDGCSGAMIWFYLPGHGRFIFSLQARPGYAFQKVGTIEDNKILFTMGGNKYEWHSEKPVLGNGGKWNLWVLHDKAYEPDNDEEVIKSLSGKKDERNELIRKKCCLIGATDSIDLLFSKPVPKANRKEEEN